jgi:1-pyrroline-5-carboxylate dehydrogenase
MASETKVTYATLSADDDEMHRRFDAGITKVKGELGRTYPLHIAGKSRPTRETSASTSPADTRVVVARVAAGTAADVEDAVAAAKAAFPGWRHTAWQTRAEILGRAAKLVRERRFELSAWLILEMGKNRLEALGEIEELADLIDYYNGEMRAHDGYVRPMGRLGANDTNTSVLRPFGVWAVIAPWNFPYALFGAPIAAALVTGNTVVAKPASDTPLSGVLIGEIFQEAGLPPGVLNLLTGSGRVVGSALVQHPDLEGLTFTGSYDVGFNDLYKKFSRTYPKPCIVEMGGKNPAIVMDSADLERAASGIFRSAFGMNGHKCSACSRVYVHEAVADELLARLGGKLDETAIGDPLERGSYLGPLATKGSHDDYQRYMALARAGGGIAVASGGKLLTEGAYAHGYFAQPAILTGVPRTHELVKTELFVPILTVERIKTMDEALGLANDTDFGLTAGVFSRKQEEIDQFLERIEAGVVYVNRAAGATTGAWPGVQPFGGWKASGSTGKNIGGVYTLPCYLREQSRTVVS